MKNILLAIADSTPSENKWKEVLSIAQPSKASLTIMHVMVDTTPLLNAVDGALERNHGIKLAEEQTGKYDLLVLGRTPTKSLWSRIIGSVSKRVMKKSHTPVFLVPSSN